jgi:hypothetical protein
MKYYADGKSLDALLEGIKGKRKSLANNEYISMASIANFGNMFSMA